MKKVVIDEKNTILLSQVGLNTPIFIRDRGKLIGMIAAQSDGWKVLLSGDYYLPKNWTSREEMIKALMRESDLHEFFVESENESSGFKKCDLTQCRLNDPCKLSGCKEFTYIASCPSHKLSSKKGEKL